MDENGRFFIGEAGGFQDFLFGFGMNSAIYSAYNAVKAITQSENFENSINKKMIPYMKASLVNRFLYEKLDENKKYKICQLLSKSKNPLNIIKKRSIYSLKKKLIFKLFNKKINLL